MTLRRLTWVLWFPCRGSFQSPAAGSAETANELSTVA